MPLPIEFDQNEWFVCIACVLSYAVLFLLPKKIPNSLVVLIFIYSFTVARLYDTVLASPWVDFYDIMDTGKYDLFDIILYVMYAPFGYFFIYAYETFNIKGLGIILYILIWSAAGTGFEHLNSIFDVFEYKNWRPIYSLSVYFITQAGTIALYTFLKKMYENLLVINHKARN